MKAMAFGFSSLESKSAEGVVQSMRSENLLKMKNPNAVMIQDGIPQPERLRRLNEIAIHQMRVLSSGGGRNLLR